MRRAPVRRRGRRSLAAAFVALVLGAVLAAVPPPASAHWEAPYDHQHFGVMSTAVLGYEGTTVQVKLRKSINYGGALTLNIGYSNASAGFSKTADLTSAPSSVTIPSSQHEATLSIQIAADSLQEADESVVLTFTTSNTRYSPVPQNSDPNARATNKVLLTIPANKYFRVGNAAVYEGQRAVVDVWLTANAPTGGLAFSVANNLGTTGAATADDLDAILPTSVTVPAGQRRVSLSIPIKQDAGNSEAFESFTLTFSTTVAGWAPFNNNDSIGDYNTATVSIWSDEIECLEFPSNSGCGDGSGATEGAIEIVRRPTGENADLIWQIYDWRDDLCCVHIKAHTDRWNRALLGLGQAVSDSTLTPMTAAEAQAFADRGWTRWTAVAAALEKLESANSHAALIAQIHGWRDDPRWSWQAAHVARWDRALLALGETVSDTTLTPMTAAEAQAFVDNGWTRWTDVAAALKAIEAG
ncbi:hypothetical protein [Candidatus Poriferisodalis sp.]|uniref:hypothetical protein n=1 Tax=Candidatus Poriferisodalis sp. TaxID=3101277 RepID=UPI003B018D80